MENKIIQNGVSFLSFDLIDTIVTPNIYVFRRFFVDHWRAKNRF